MSWGGSEGQRTSPAAVCNMYTRPASEIGPDSNESEQRETCARFYYEHTITAATGQGSRPTQRETDRPSIGHFSFPPTLPAMWGTARRARHATIGWIASGGKGFAKDRKIGSHSTNQRIRARFSLGTQRISSILRLRSTRGRAAHVCTKMHASVRREEEKGVHRNSLVHQAKHINEEGKKSKITNKDKVSQSLALVPCHLTRDRISRMDVMGRERGPEN